MIFAGWVPGLTITICNKIAGVDWSRRFWFTSCKFGFVFDPWLHELQLLYLNISTLHCSFLWRTDSIAYVKLNKPTLTNKPPTNVLEINKPPGVWNNQCYLLYLYSMVLSPRSHKSALHLYTAISVKGCRKNLKYVQQSRELLWVILSSQFFKEICKNVTRGEC